MKREEAQVLVKAIEGLIEKDGGTPRVDVARVPGLPVVTRAETPAAHLDTSDKEALYQAFKRRLIDECAVDPILLHLLTARPEIVVEVEPRTMTLEGSTLKGRLARLMAAKWFTDTRLTGQVKAELMRTGTEPNGGNLSTALSDFVRDGFLTRDGAGFRLAPGVEISEQQIKVV